MAFPQRSAPPEFPGSAKKKPALDVVIGVGGKPKPPQAAPPPMQDDAPEGDGPSIEESAAKIASVPELEGPLKAFLSAMADYCDKEGMEPPEQEPQPGASQGYAG